MAKKAIILGLSGTGLLFTGAGLFVLWRMLQASKTEGGAGEGEAERPTSGPCAKIEDQLSTPIGCGVVSVDAYLKGERARVTIAEVPGFSGFYLQRSPVDAFAAFSRMRQAIQASGIKVKVNSAFRTMAKQKELYTKYLTGRGALAAKPGRSNHQYGVAVDLDVKSNPKLLSWLRSNAGSYGFHQAVPSENWHWEYDARRDTRAGVA